jgi:sigma-B regulation protein RsbU (phosphoserine phosphatase)
MDTTLRAETAVIRDELARRRERLVIARSTLQPSDELTRLLREVDSALERINNGSYGLCDECHEQIEPDRLISDPFIRTCLDHLTAAEQRKLERDLDLAGSIQRSLLPRPEFSVAGWDTAFRYEPLGSSSGDYCDLIAAGPGEMLFLLGDVAGKGVAASVLMSHLHATFRSLVSLQLPFEDLMERANQIFYESAGGRHYATLVCGRARATGEIELSNAGHCPPLLIRASGATEVPATGLPIGMFCSTPYTATRINLGPGDALLLYTDGVTESVDRVDREYGPRRLADVMAAGTWRAAQDLVQTCLTDVAAFRAGVPPPDDVTVLAIRRTA